MLWCILYSVTLCGERSRANVNVSLSWTILKFQGKCSSSVLDSGQAWFIWGKKVVLEFFVWTRKIMDTGSSSPPQNPWSFELFAKSTTHKPRRNRLASHRFCSSKQLKQLYVIFELLCSAYYWLIQIHFNILLYLMKQNLWKDSWFKVFCLVFF